MKKKAFTLIELLVVIAIIAILLAVLMPALKKAKLIAKTIVCSSNCKTLSTAWSTYAAENHDKIVSSKTGFGLFGEHLMNPPYKFPNAWVDWAGYPNYNDPADKERQILAVQRGALFPYVKTIKAYRCPLSKKDQVRCYTMPDVIGNEQVLSAPERGAKCLVTKANQIKMTSDRIIFLDEDDITYGGFSIYFDRPSWWDMPPKRHNNGITLGYADGHSEYYKWKDKQTIDLVQGVTSNLSQPGNQDLVAIQRGVFGTLGYTP